MNTPGTALSRHTVPSKYILAFNLLVIVAALGMSSLAPVPTMAQQIRIPEGKCVDPRGCVPSSSSGSGSGYSGPNLWDILRNIGSSGAEEERQQRINEARTANEQGLQAYKNGDWAKAVALFQEAANKNPDNATIRQNLATAKEMLANAQAEQRMQQQARVSAERMQQSIQSFAQSLNAAPVSGGLDFDGRTSGNAPSGGSGGLDFTAAIAAPSPALRLGDPMVVDARNVPSGLLPAVDTAIAGVFASAPPGVRDRVRKGFQAATAGDWPVAQAWFADALNRDPGNLALKNLIAAARSSAAPARAAQSAPPSRDAVVDLYRRGYDAVIAGDWPSAIAAFEAAMRRDPSPGGSIGTYVAYLRATARTAQTTPPSQDEVADLYRRGHDAVIAGDRRGAIAAFEAAMRRDPSPGGSIGNYVAYLRATPESTTAGTLQLPQDSDMELLFNPQWSPAQTPVRTPQQAQADAIYDSVLRNLGMR